MTIFFRWTAIYVALGIIFVLLTREDPQLKIAQMIASIPGMFSRFWHLAWWVLIPLGAVAVTQWNKGFRERVPMIIGTFVACSAISVIFPMVKSALPLVNAFWADPMFADIDRVLHGGVDPWVLTHADWIQFPMVFADAVYVGLWIIPALYFPLLLAFFDPNEARVARYSMIYLFILFFLGNVLAGLFMSAGPIYYDRLLGGDTFAALLASLEARGIGASSTGVLHDRLWIAYSENAQEFGSGISAFPSVHVAMTVLLACYLSDLSRWLIPLGVAVVCLFQFLSVYLAWHYAVDGYASILVVVLAWALTRKFAPQTNVATQLTPT